MRRFVIAAAVVAGFGLGGVVSDAAARPASSTPEVDNANAKSTVQGRLVVKNCVGEDGVAYSTYRGSWVGGSQTDVTPGSTDYSLSGSLTVTGIVWPINLATGRGVLTGTITLATSSGPTYSGKLTLITEGVPAAGSSVPGRGWVVAGIKLPDEAVPPPGDDSLLANTEWIISSGGGVATAVFGDAAGSLGIPNFSVVTNVAPRALDGVC